MAITGRLVVLAAAGMVAVVVWPVPGMVALWALVVVAVAALDVVLAASPRQVSLARTVPRVARLGESAVTTLTVRNESRRTLRALVRDAWQPSAGAPRVPEAGQGPSSRRRHSAVGKTGLVRAGEDVRHRLDVRSGDGARVRTVLRPTRRGDLVAGAVTIRSLGPLGMAGRQASIPVPGTLRVLPEFRSRRMLPSYFARLREIDGRTAVMIRGQGTEFDSLREYTPGDDVRSIDWRATARADHVVVRTWRPERDRRVIIVVDTSRLAAARLGDSGGSSGIGPGASASDGSSDGTRLDASIEAALFLGVLASRAGDRVEVVAVDRTVRAQVMGVSGAQVLPRFAEALAPLTPRLVETNWALVAASVREAVTGRALVVIMSAIEPAAVESGVAAILPSLLRDHKVILAGAADPATEALRHPLDGEGPVSTVELFDAAAAERAALERDALADYLDRKGAWVINALPGDLAAEVANAYLTLKATRQL